MKKMDRVTRLELENNLQTALKESLALFPVDELKAEQRLIIKKIVARREVLGQLPTGYSCLKA